MRTNKPPLQRVIDSYDGVPCEFIRPDDATHRPGEPCGEIHEHCRGHARSRRPERIERRGEPCGLQAMPGAVVCCRHGPAPHIRAQAQRRIAVAKARGAAGQMLELAGQSIAGRSDVEALEAARHHAATVVESWAMVVAQLDPTSSDDHGWIGPDVAGNLRVHPAMQEYRHWLREQAKIDKLSIDAGLDERRQRLDEAHMAGVLAVVRETLKRHGLPWGDDVEATVAGQFRAFDAIETQAIETGDGEPTFDDDDGLNDDGGDGLAGSLFDGSAP